MLRQIVRGVLLLVVVTSSTNAGWKDIFGCNRDHADPCDKCTVAEMEKYWPEHKADIGKAEEIRRQEMSELTYGYDLVDAKFEAMYEYAQREGDTESMKEIFAAQRELFSERLEESRRIMRAFGDQCRRIFFDKY